MARAIANAKRTAEQRHTNGFNLVSAIELLAVSEPETRWIWDGVLPEGGMSLIVGKPKAGKSTFAFALSLAVAEGQDFLNRHTTKGTSSISRSKKSAAKSKRSSKPPGGRSRIFTFIWCGASGCGSECQ